MKKGVFFIFSPLVFNMERTDTGWMVVLEKKGLHEVAGILENYGIDSETHVSLLDQGDLRNLVSQGLRPIQLKKRLMDFTMKQCLMDFWCVLVNI
jgi:hypothetical protein